MRTTAQILDAARRGEPATEEELRLALVSLSGVVGATLRALRSGDGSRCVVQAAALERALADDLDHRVPSCIRPRAVAS